MLRVGLVAGETSGDVLGAGLISAIRQAVPDARFEGVAGTAMLSAGCERWEDADALAVMGLIEPLKHIPRLLRLRRALFERWRENPPDVFVGIDAPDFNLGLEQKLKAAGIRTVHYVSPTVWAWRASRIRKIRKAVDTMLCILPFEKALYDEHGIDAVFVGHPKADAAPASVSTGAARRALGIDATRVVTVLPGSRGSEVQRLGPDFARAAALLAAARSELHFITPVAVPKLRPVFEQHLESAGIRERFTLLDGCSEQAMSAADVVLTASGTAVLEAALLSKPCVAAYRVAAATYVIIRLFGLVKLAHVTMPNLLTEEPLVPEFIQNDATADALAGATGRLLDDPARCEAIAKRFAKLREELALGANRRAAEAVIRVARG